MVFFRIKKIKGNEYAYVVENEWHKKGSRQKVKGYIGKIYRPELKNDIDFFGYLKIGNFQNYIESNENSRILNDLIEWELFRFGISKEEFSIDIAGKSVQKKKRDVVFLINDGFMCSLTLNKLTEFKPEGDEANDGYRVARLFVEAGIKVPQDVFVAFFNKLYKPKEDLV